VKRKEGGEVLEEEEALSTDSRREGNKKIKPRPCRGKGKGTASSSKKRRGRPILREAQDAKKLAVLEDGRGRRVLDRAEKTLF